MSDRESVVGPTQGALASHLAGPGWLVRRDVLDPELVDRLRHAVDDAVEAETAYHGGVDHHWHNRVLFCPVYGGAFLDVLDLEAVFHPVEALLGGDPILYTMSTSRLPPGGTNTSSELHVDLSQVVPGYLLGISIFLALDDLGEATGSARLLPGSQERTEPPSDAEFDQAAVHLDAPAGSVAFVHPHLWHRSTRNTTPHVRRAVLLLVVRSWMKQRFDVGGLVPSAILGQASPVARRRLGLDAAPPASYDEYYERGRLGTHRSGAWPRTR